MPSVNTGRTPLISRLLPFALLTLSAMLCYWLYQRAFLGGFMYDDAISLSGLQSVVDPESALLYVMAGDAGPLGRPLSLATFLVNAPSWPSDASAFLYFNTLLHLANGFLLAWLALIVARTMPDRIHSPAWFATLVAAVWLLHPAWTFLVLHAVQRMAILETTFVLLGLVAYLKARTLLATQPLRSMSLMAASLALGTLLATLSKENGVLLPLFAATLEWLLRNTGSNTTYRLSPALGFTWKYWQVALFWLPALVLATYLFQHWPGFHTGAAIREFTGGQRLLTEARVLWQYLINSALPRPLNFTPFYDDYIVSKDLFTPITTLYALLGWTLVAGLAWHWRRRFPMFFFGFAWFFVGHSIESTVVQLEIYFEHRNYLPSIGLVMLAVYGLWQLPQKLEQLRGFIAGVYLLLIATTLWQVTDLWATPALAAPVWAARHPLSPRTIEFYANYLGSTDRGREAADIIWQAHLRLPDDTGLAVQGAELRCWYSRPEEYEQIVNGILPQLRTGSFSHLPSELLPVMFNQLRAGGCTSQRTSHLHKITDALLMNPKYKASARDMATLHYIQGRLYMRERNFNLTLVNFLESSRYEPNLDLSLEISNVFASGGLYDEALQTLEEAKRNAPEDPVIRMSWHKRLEAQRLKLLKTMAAKSPTAAPSLSGQR